MTEIPHRHSDRSTAAAGDPHSIPRPFLQRLIDAAAEASLTDSEFRVLVTMAADANEDGLAFGTVARYAERCGLQPRSVKRIRASLEAKGFLADVDPAAVEVHRERTDRTKTPVARKSTDGPVMNTTRAFRVIPAGWSRDEDVQKRREAAAKRNAAAGRDAAQLDLLNAGKASFRVVQPPPPETEAEAEAEAETDNEIPPRRVTAEGGSDLGVTPPVTRESLPSDSGVTPPVTQASLPSDPGVIPPVTRESLIRGTGKGSVKGSSEGTTSSHENGDKKPVRYPTTTKRADTLEAYRPESPPIEENPDRATAAQVRQMRLLAKKLVRIGHVKTEWPSENEAASMSREMADATIKALNRAESGDDFVTRGPAGFGGRAQKRTAENGNEDQWKPGCTHPKPITEYGATFCDDCGATLPPRPDAE